MNSAAQKHPPLYWVFLACMAAGIFAGTFWLFFGMFLLLGRDPAWWQVAATLAPGAGIIFLVIMARYHPRPYGTGLMILGVLPLLAVHFSSAWLLRLGFALPLLLIGLGMVLAHRGAPVAAGELTHG